MALKFVTTVVLVFKKIESEDKPKSDIFYSNSKAEIIIKESDIDDVFQSIYTTIISKYKKLEIYTKWEKRIPSPLVFFVLKIRKNIQFMYQRNVVKKNMLIHNRRKRQKKLCSYEKF